MQSVIIPLIVSICFVVISVLCINKNRQDTNNIKESCITHGNQVDTKIVILEGHKYIILDTDCGADIIHAESCNCKSKGVIK